MHIVALIRLYLLNTHFITSNLCKICNQIIFFLKIIVFLNVFVWVSGCVDLKTMFVCF